MNTKTFILFTIFLIALNASQTRVKQGGTLIDFNFSSFAPGFSQSLSCHSGDRIRIRLEENPTTGYQWMIPEDIENLNVIWSLESSEYVSNNNNSGMVGVGGIRTFILSVNSPGEEKLTFVYGRPWLYDNTMENYRNTGIFDPSIMQGNAVQLVINAA